MGRQFVHRYRARVLGDEMRPALSMGRSLRKSQDGFALPEMMVTILVMVVVLFALYSIFDASIKVFSFGNDKVESVESVRVAMERMEREIRSAYPQNGAAGERTVIYGFASGLQGSITFGNDSNK